MKRVILEFSVSQEVYKKIESLELQPEVILLNENAEIVVEPIVASIKIVEWLNPYIQGIEK